LPYSQPRCQYPNNQFEPGQRSLCLSYRIHAAKYNDQRLFYFILFHFILKAESCMVYYIKSWDHHWPTDHRERTFQGVPFMLRCPRILAHDESAGLWERARVLAKQSYSYLSYVLPRISLAIRLSYDKGTCFSVVVSPKMTCNAGA
jgi:hypothetical protein